MRLQADQEGKHAHEIEQKNSNIEELTDMVEELAARLRVFQVCMNGPYHAQSMANEELASVIIEPLHYLKTLV